ncbi:MAG: peptidoglycan DD-metalloendopeptidase family protein [Candidatus Cloacimonetes bacterium]|nr:peptidoglycan DD-metalloendopeptidase family protein [Candidatus Cloacimonadota bacterium]
MGSRSMLLALLLVIILISIIVFDQVRIKNLEVALGRIMILSGAGDSLVVYHPLKLTERQVLLTPEFVDSFTRYKSPFWDGIRGEDRSLQDLINEYVHNRNEDHYGSRRGGNGIKRIHEGLDLFVPENTPVYPLSDYGVVIDVSHNPNHLEWVACTNAAGAADSVQVEYGKLVTVLYPEGITSTYVHLNEVKVEIGEEVHGDTVLGLTGVTGNLIRSGKASHLHLEMRYLDGTSYDPRHRLHYRGTSFGEFVKMLKI